MHLVNLHMTVKWLHVATRMPAPLSGPSILLQLPVTPQEAETSVGKVSTNLQLSSLFQPLEQNLNSFQDVEDLRALDWVHF